MKYRLEYNEQKGRFHLDNYTHVENTFGWTTIIESITNDEAYLFFLFMDYGLKDKVKKYKTLKVKYKAELFLKILNYDPTRK